MATYSTLYAAEVNVAVAANFSGPMAQIIPAFEQATGHKVQLALGTVGKFYAQIHSGAPFEVLASADAETPRKLAAEGLADASTCFTYANGKLVLWSARPGYVDAQGSVLKTGNFEHLAIANPKVAVYGAAAMTVLDKLGLSAQLTPKLVIGESITQAHQFVATGNAELGFVALSQVYKNGQVSSGSYWLVPPALYPAIQQDAILLTRGKGNPAAQALLDYLKSEAARKVIRSFGYDL